MSDIEKAAAKLRLRKGGEELQGRLQPIGDTESLYSADNDAAGASTNARNDSQGRRNPFPEPRHDSAPPLSRPVTVESRNSELLTDIPQESEKQEQKAPEVTLEIPLGNLLEAGYLVPDTPKGRMTEEYRRIKRPLLKNLAKTPRPDNSNIIVVTSSVTGEGKTFTAVNLAMSFALERDRTVLLIDADVIKGSAGKLLEVSESAMGLTDFLAGTCTDIGQAIMPTNVPSLSFMPAGSRHDDANELLASSNMTHCFNELSERYGDRIIVVDSSPLLQTNEANIISEHANQIVFVVAEGETPQRLTTQALSFIDKDKYVGVLLNKSSSTGKGYGYGYAYGYE